MTPRSLVALGNPFDGSRLPHQLWRVRATSLFRAGFGLLFVAVVTQRLPAPTATLTAVEDTTITEKSPDTPQGGDAQLQIGTTGPAAGYKSSRSLLRFELTAIPTNATVTRATLTVNLEQVAPGVTNLWVNLHRVVRPWSEAFATWSNRLAATPWSVPGAAAPADFVLLATQSNRITTTLGLYTFASGPRMVADVQDWVRIPATNHGWIMISQLQSVGQTECKFTAHEATSAASRPRLMVDYVLPANPPTLIGLSPSNGMFRFQFTAEASRAYTVETSAIMPATNWSVMTNLGPFPNPSNVVVSDSIQPGARLYRVRTF